MSNHTPGPWFAKCHPDDPKHTIAVFSTKHPICKVAMGWKEDRGTDEANARLIAAAPELFDSSAKAHHTYGKLHDIISDCIERGVINEDYLPDDYQAIVEQLAKCNTVDNSLCNAIEKAKGEKPQTIAAPR